MELRALAGTFLVARLGRHVPKNFTFSFKVSRYLTHMKKLKPAEEAIERLLGTANVLDPGLMKIMPSNLHSMNLLPGSKPS